MAIDVGALKLDTQSGLLARINTEWHKRGLVLFGIVVALHWAEHIAQAIQIWVFHFRKPEARGLVGAHWPWLIKSEWLHYGFAIVMLVGLAILLPGFSGWARRFWIAALVIQIWHFAEHQLLFIQALTHQPWFGAKMPTSILQQFWPMNRPELHLFYNAVVTIPMIIAVYFHMFPPLMEHGRNARCGCARNKEPLAA